MGKEREKRKKERKGEEEKKRGRKGNYLEGEKCLEQQMRGKIGKEKLCRFGECGGGKEIGGESGEPKGRERAREENGEMGLCGEQN